MEYNTGIIVTDDAVGNCDGWALSWNHPYSADERFMPVHCLPSRSCTRVSR